MSISSVGTATSIDPLAKQIAERLDKNSDGTITTSEFGDFLSAVLKSRESSGGANGVSELANSLLSALSGGGASMMSLDPPETSGAIEERPPSTWTDNNAPYGVTFAGFSPQNHTNLTLEDLGVPGKAEKYAVYHHLLTNKVQPTSDWAPAAAEALNKRYNTTVYHAIDGETLGYGFEYVHSAPNGYGMARGTYNPNATGEFFWGTMEGLV